MTFFTQPLVCKSNVTILNLDRLTVRRLLSTAAKTTMVGATSTQIMEFVCLAHANLYDKRIQLTSLASLGIGMTLLVSRFLT